MKEKVIGNSIIDLIFISFYTPVCECKLFCIVQKGDSKWCDILLKGHPIAKFDQEFCELLFPDGTRRLMDGPALINTFSINGDFVDLTTAAKAMKVPHLLPKNISSIIEFD